MQLELDYLVKQFDETLLKVLNRRLAEQGEKYGSRFATVVGTKQASGNYWLQSVDKRFEAFVEKPMTHAQLALMSIQETKELAQQAGNAARIRYTEPVGPSFMPVTPPARITHNILNLKRVQIIGED